MHILIPLKLVFLTLVTSGQVEGNKDNNYGNYLMILFILNLLYMILQ